MKLIRPNVFQQLLRRWELVHPYNAAQILVLESSALAADWKRAWSAALAEMRLGTIRFERGRYQFEPPETAGAAGESALPDFAGVRLERTGSLADFINREMNRPFPKAESFPFRPFVIEGEAAYVGIVYQHWVADSVSVRALLHRWFLHALHPSSVANLPANFREPAGGYWHYFGPQHGGWNVFDAFLRAWIWSQDMRRVRQMKIWHSSSHAMQVMFRSGTDGCVDRVRARARELGATVNDLFLAGLFIACDRHMPARRARRRRNWLLGSIVDLRPYAREDLRGVFGMFLGFSDTICRPRDLRDWPTLVGAVASQTRRQRRPGQMRSGIFRLTGAAAACTILSPAHGTYFCRKHAPLTAGISNVNLSDSWPAQFHPNPILDYLRVSPTGPMAPLVLSVTTVGGKLNVAATCRPSVVEPAVMERIVDEFLARVSET